MQILKKDLVSPILVVIAAFGNGEQLYTIETHKLNEIDPSGAVPMAQYRGHIRNAFWIDSSDLDEINRLAKAWRSNMRVVKAKNNQNNHD